MNEEKVARICWNTRDWKRPSGSAGKSLGKDAYEHTVGFGHEEWLLDDTKIMPDGYHYGFLQPINTKSRIYEGKVFDIHLFVFDTIHRVKAYIGCLHNVECITEHQAKNVYKHYKKVGWLKEMKEDVIFAGATIKDMDANGLMFNIRFKFSDAKINYSNRPIIAKEDPNTQGLYYKLMDKKGDFIFEKDESNDIQYLNTDSFVKTSHSGEILIDPLHKKIQNAVAELLKDKYEHLYFEKTEKSHGKMRIDIKGKFAETGEWHYFEVKTSSAKQSIREAFGQILEYSLYDTSHPRAKKMFIIGPEKPDEKDKVYMQMIRDLYQIPIWFRWYSFEDNKLHEEI